MKYFKRFALRRSKVNKDSSHIDISIPKITTNHSATFSEDEAEELRAKRQPSSQTPNTENVVPKIPKMKTQNPAPPSRSKPKEDTDAPWLMMDMMLSDTREEADITPKGKVVGGSRDGMDPMSQGIKSKSDRRVDLPSTKKTHGSNRNLSTGDVFHTKIEFDNSQLSNKPLGSDLFVEPSTNTEKAIQPKDMTDTPKNKFPFGVVSLGSWRSSSSSGSSIQKSEQAKAKKNTTTTSQTNSATLQKMIPFELIRIGSGRSNCSGSTLGVDMEDPIRNNYAEKGPFVRSASSGSDWEQKVLEKMAEVNTRHRPASTLKADVKNFFPAPKQVPARREKKPSTDSFFPSVAFPHAGSELRSDAFLPSVAFPPVLPVSLDVSVPTMGKGKKVTKTSSQKSDDKQQSSSDATRDGPTRYPTLALGVDPTEQELRMNALLTKLKLQDGARKDRKHDNPVKLTRKVSRKFSFKMGSTHSENSRSTIRIANKTSHSSTSSTTPFHLFNDSAHSSFYHASKLLNFDDDDGSLASILREIEEEEAWSELQGQWDQDEKSFEDNMHIAKAFASNNMQKENPNVIQRVKEGIPYAIPQYKMKPFVNYEIADIHFESIHSGISDNKSRKN